MSIILNGVSATVSETTDGHIITCNQVITDEFLETLKQERFESMNVREREHQRVASIPVVLIDKWIKDGFDFWNESNAKIVAKLKHEGLDYFVTTAKAI
jgi:NMD protein affecting ribosome stability and mRNA decay